jgi:hypothetical protein
MGSRDRLDGRGKEKVPHPCRYSNPEITAGSESLYQLLRLHQIQATSILEAADKISKKVVGLKRHN